MEEEKHEDPPEVSDIDKIRAKLLQEMHQAGIEKYSIELTLRVLQLENILKQIIEHNKKPEN